MLREIFVSLCLLPVLIGQAIYVRARIPQLPEAEGPRHGEIGQGPLLRLLVLGDSSAAGVGATTQDEALLGQVLQELSTSYTVRFDLVAQTGARTRDAVAWVRSKTAQTYDVVIVALGANDIIKGTSLPRFLRTQDQLYAHLVADRGAQCVLISALPPIGHFPALPNPLRWVLGRRAKRFNSALRAAVAQRQSCVSFAFGAHLEVAAMASDGFHPGPVVYAAWGQSAAQVIRDQPLQLDAALTGP